MATFKYTAYQAADMTKMVEGSIDAEDRTQASNMLISSGLRPIRLQEVANAKVDGKSFSLDFRKTVKVQELAFFTRQLSTLLQSGISILDALEITARPMTNEKFKTVILATRDDIQEGVPISRAMGKHPDVFTPLYTSLVSAGESGEVSVALTRLADMLEVQAQNRREIRAAMFYPVGVLIFTLVVFIAMMLFVVPAFQGIFKQAGGNLPAPTQALVVASNFCRTYFYLIPVIIGGAIFGGRKLKATPKGTRLWDTFKLRGKGGIGPITEKAITARFFRTLSTLQAAGVPLLQAMEIARPTASNVLVEEAIDDAIREMQEGKPLSNSIEDTGMFPDLAVSMLTSGEKAGQLSQMLDQVAATYEEEVSASVKGVKAIIEPVMMMVIGTFVGGIVVALYLPMFSVYDQIK